MQTRLRNKSGQPAPIPGNSATASSSTASAPVPTSNTFEMLADDDDNDLEVESLKISAAAKQKVSRLPPIYIMGMDIPSTIAVLNKAGVQQSDTVQYQLKLTKTSVQLLAKSKEVFSAVLSALKKNNVDFFTYNVAEDNPTNIVLQGLPEISIPDLKEELELINITHRPSSYFTNPTKMTTRFTFSTSTRGR